MYSRFTAEAMHVMRRARALLDESEQRHVLPEHLLLAMLELSRSDVSTVLKGAGVSRGALTHYLLELRDEWTADAPELSGVTSYITVVRPLIDEALMQAAREGQLGITTRHLLFGLLDQSGGTASRLLRERGVTLEAAATPPAKSVERAGDRPDFVITHNPFRLSPVFLLVVALTVAAGVLCYIEPASVNGGVAVFLLVTGGWIISLALHEFGHALVGYYAGDRSVAQKGYLTLNPLKYTHPLLSLGLPLLIMVMGGIGLPGGAVYIDRSVIRKEWQHSLISAAGPIATLLVTLTLSVALSVAWVFDDWYYHSTFWSGLALLLLFQVTALFINLLPLPGLDGFGIIAVLLSPERRYAMQRMGGLSFMVLMFLFFWDTPLTDGFWLAIFRVTDWLGVDRSLIGYGYNLFRFWGG